MHARLALALIFTTVQLVTLVATQPPNVSGSWALEAAAASGEFSNGGTWNLNALSGTLTLERKADAVTGSWQGRQPQPWALNGRAQGDTFELESEERDVAAERNGEKITVRRRWIFRGTVDGDKLTGSMMLAGREGESPSQSFTAVRKRP